MSSEPLRRLIVSLINSSSFYIFIRLLLLGVVPLSLLVFLNIRVFTAINSRKSSSKDRSYSVILLLIVAIFIFCHVPRQTTVVFNKINYVLFCNFCVFCKVNFLPLNLFWKIIITVYFYPVLIVTATVLCYQSCSEYLWNNRNGPNQPMWSSLLELLLHHLLQQSPSRSQLHPQLLHLLLCWQEVSQGFVCNDILPETGHNIWSCVKNKF